MTKLLISLNGKEVEVSAMKIKGQVWFHYQGETYCYSPKSSSSQSSSAAGASDPTQILAPMPGKIIKVFVKVGESVKEGETLIAMEAMKMEYNLKAQQPMQVTEVLCAAGQTVGLGDKLVSLEEIDV